MLLDEYSLCYCGNQVPALWPLGVKGEGPVLKGEGPALKDEVEEEETDTAFLRRDVIEV